jgi:hypothetical protein
MTEPKVVKCPKLYGVIIPMSIDRDFVSPNFEDGVKFYPEFLKQSWVKMSFQGYICYLMKILDKEKPNGHDGHRTFQNWLRHEGMRHFENLVKEYGKLYESYKEKKKGNESQKNSVDEKKTV